MVDGGFRLRAFRTAVVVSTLLAAGHAQAHHAKHGHSTHHQHRYAAAAGGARVIQCVAFAKQDAGIEISGNARDWWGNAAGVYERGSQPENGSVLSFLANGRMPLGHVAVVSGIEDSRTIVIDQSHWNSRGVTRDIEVKDVSEANDWSAVRVQLGHGAAFGSIYPTHGFIYPRPAQNAAEPDGAQAPYARIIRTDYRPGAARRSRAAVLEVAEAPQSGRALDLTVPGISFDAPSRAFR
jgi:hypothetical protein